MNDNVRLAEERVASLVKDRVTEIQAAARNNIQKVNTEITYLREQLAARQLTEGAIPNQALPVTDVDVEKSGLVTSASDNHMRKDSIVNCTTSVCGDAKKQPGVNSNSEPAIANVPSDMFANNSPINEITLPKFCDSPGKIRGEFNKKSLKPCLEEETLMGQAAIRILRVVLFTT
jgi:hypothetical protein